MNPKLILLSNYNNKGPGKLVQNKKYWYWYILYIPGVKSAPNLTISLGTPGAERWGLATLIPGADRWGLAILIPPGAERCELGTMTPGAVRCGLLAIMFAGAMCCDCGLATMPTPSMYSPLKHKNQYYIFYNIITYFTYKK